MCAGTNAQDGISLLYASLQDFLRRGTTCPRVIACSHFTELLELPDLCTHPSFTLWKMRVLLQERSPSAESTNGTTRTGIEATGTGTGTVAGSGTGPGPGITTDTGTGTGCPQGKRQAFCATSHNFGVACASDRDDDRDELNDVIKVGIGLGSSAHERSHFSRSLPWPGNHLAYPSAELDEVVFLYWASPGSCTDTFGAHCAAAADMPISVIKRAWHVSRCRFEGRTVERADTNDEIASSMEQRIAIVETFLRYNFDAETATDFYRSTDFV